MKQSKETLKSYFQTNDKPTETQFSDLIDSYIDAKQTIGEEDRRFIIDATGEVTVSEKLVVPEYSLTDLEDSKVSLLKDEQIISEIDLSGLSDNNILKKKEITFAIDDLNPANLYEVLPPVGENTVIILHKVVFDINIVTAYDEFASNNLFNLEQSSGLLLHTSPYIDTNSSGRTINVSTTSSNVTFSDDDSNSSVHLKPNFGANNGSLTIKIILFYSLIEL